MEERRMSEYTELIKALRCKRDDCEGCDLAFFDNDEGWMCQYAEKDDDAADAIEALQAEVARYKDAFGRLSKTAVELEQRVFELKEMPKRGEIVRCGDCKYKPHWDERVSEEDRDGFDIIFPVDYKCPCQCDDGWYSWMPDGDWFCADGEREVQDG
jgi:hypothetical protein